MAENGKAVPSVRLVPLRDLPATFDDAAERVLRDAFWDYPVWQLLGAPEEETLKQMVGTFHRAVVTYHRKSFYLLLRDVSDEKFDAGDFTPADAIGACAGWRSDDAAERETIGGWLLSGLYVYPWRYGVAQLRRLFAVGDVVGRAEAEVGRKVGRARWLVEYVGVEKAWACLGLGTVMVKKLLGAMEAEDPNLGFDLVTHVARNVPWYESLGFRCTTEKKELTVEGRSCYQWHMVRPALGEE